MNGISILIFHKANMFPISLNYNKDSVNTIRDMAGIILVPYQNRKYHQNHCAIFTIDMKCYMYIKNYKYFS